MRMKLGRRAVVCGLALAIGAPVVLPAPADAAVVICQRKKRLKLRIDACKTKETQVDAAELGVTGPQGPQGVEGPSNLLAAVHIGADGTLLSSHAAPGIAVSTSKDFCDGCYRVELSGTGAFAGMTANDLIVQATARSAIWGVANAAGDQFGELTPDLAVVQTYAWVSDTAGGPGDVDNDVYVVIYRGSPPTP